MPPLVGAAPEVESPLLSRIAYETAWPAMTIAPTASPTLMLSSQPYPVGSVPDMLMPTPNACSASPARAPPSHIAGVASLRRRWEGTRLAAPLDLTVAPRLLSCPCEALRHLEPAMRRHETLLFRTWRSRIR